MATPRKTYKPQFKLEVVKIAEAHGKHFASKMFGVDRKRVREWCKTKEELKCQCIAEGIGAKVNIKRNGGKRTHRSFSPKFKLEVIKVAEENGKKHATKMFDVDPKRVREWCRWKDKIQQMSGLQNRNAGTGRKVLSVEVEKQFVKWLQEAGVCVTSQDMRSKALLLHDELGLELPFRASDGWFVRFKRRHHISSLEN